MIYRINDLQFVKQIVYNYYLAKYIKLVVYELLLIHYLIIRCE